MYQLGWFSTGRDKAARDLLKAVNSSIRQSEIKAEIAFVSSNREPGESEETDLFFKLVEDYHIPLTCFSYQKFKASKGALVTGQTETLPSWRLDYDREVMNRLQDFHPDLCVLAGYMLVVGGEMCQRYDMINLHPAAPGGPAGTWQEVIWQLIDNKAQETGVMMHLVTPELDKGPPVTYCTFSIRGKPFDKYWYEIESHPLSEVKKKEDENNPLFKLIRQHGMAREFPLIISTLKAFSQGKIKITAGKNLIDSEGRPINGYNLTDEIDGQIKGATTLAKRKRRGPIVKDIRNLCSRTLLEPVNKPEFKKGLRKIIDEYPSYLRQIGMVMQAWIVEYIPNKKDEIWRLVGEVQPKIRQKFEK